MARAGAAALALALTGCALAVDADGGWAVALGDATATTCAQAAQGAPIERCATADGGELSLGLVALLSGAWQAVVELWPW